MDVNKKSPRFFRPALPHDLLAAARRAGAALDMSPRDYVYLALRSALSVSGNLPEGHELSEEEFEAIRCIAP